MSGGLHEEETVANDRLKANVDLLVERAAALMPALASALNEKERGPLAGLLPEAEPKEQGAVPMAEPRLELKMKPERSGSLSG